MRLLSDDEIVRFLRSLRYDPQYRQPGRRLPLGSLLKLIGVSRQTTYAIMLTRSPVTERLRVRFSQGFDLVARGLKFTRRKRAWSPEQVYVAELPPSPYALVDPRPEAFDGDPHMGVSQQALPEPVRPQRRLPAVPKVLWRAGEVVTSSVRDFEHGNPAGGSDREVACRRFPARKFPKSTHWRKQLAAARRARRRAKLRLLGGARNARMEGGPTG